MVSIVVLRFLSFSEYFISAILATMSLPVIYALSYYQAKIGDLKPKFKFKFVSREEKESLKVDEIDYLKYEALALITSFIFGLLAYVAWFGIFDIVVYTLGYVFSQFLRLGTYFWSIVFKRTGFNIERPLIILILGIINGATLALTFYLIITQAQTIIAITI